MKQKVLFVCIHNSARSQMAEAFLNQMCPEAFEAQSAGLEPGTVNPLVIESMRQVGMDISGNQTKGVSDILATGQAFDYVIAVCDGANAARCPVFPGSGKRLQWSFPDPSALTAGSREERLAHVGRIRDEIRARLQEWCAEACVAPAA
jgi:arsenate reductase